MNDTPVPFRRTSQPGFESKSTPADPLVALETRRGVPDARALAAVDALPFASLAPGQVLRNRYVLVERLETGRRGTVFKARDSYRCDLPEAEQYVAVKILHQGIDNRSESRREFYRAQRLSHQNIMKVFELDREGDTDFFTMELLEGETLGSVIQRLRPRPMSPPQAWAIIREIGLALAHAHARNVIHGNLSPYNILLTHAGDVRLRGFGGPSTAFEHRAAPPGSGHGLSTAASAYASCELQEGRSADPRDDIYALACIAYELLAGTHPFQRRCSTDARDLGIVPCRLPQLNRRQWQTLAMGLSWHRAGRSMPVGAWLDRMDAERRAVRQLPRSHELKPGPANDAPASASFRATALFAVLLMGVTVWVSVARVAPRRQSGTGGLGPSATASELRGTDAATQGPASRHAEAAPTAHPTSGAALPIASNPGLEVGRSKAAAGANPLMVSARNYRVHYGQHFAEIRVHRPNRSDRDTPFEWWTEAATAKPGIDYVHQGKVTLSIPKGKNSTSFFIKLVPKASRSQPEMFYIAVARPGHGTTPPQVERAAVWLPPNDKPS
ncbi:MAG: serine/threonine protein kinase [Pseudomonadota bacterium]|nr:serine/threonine protein kinase [Pseudomonadota bacterium]